MIRKILLIAAIVYIANSIYSGDRSGARSTSLAFSSAVSSKGNDAYGINPANYDFVSEYETKKLKTKKKDYLRWEITLLAAGGGYGSDSSIEFYNNYLKYLSIDRNKFANLFTNINEVFLFRNTILPGEKTDVNYDFELNWFILNYRDPKFGAINISVTDKVGLNTNVNSRDEYLPLTFGFDFNPNGSYNITNVNMAQSEATAWWIRKYSIGYSKCWKFKGSILKTFSIGISGSLVHGFGNVLTYESKLNISTWGVQNINGRNHVDSIKGKQDFHTQSALTDYFKDYKDGAEEHFNLFPKPAGKGYSLDFGMTMQLGSMIKLAASVTDLGKIIWDYNTITNNDTNHFAYYDFYVSGDDETYNRLVDDLGGYLTQDTGKTFSTEMPGKIRAGIMLMPSEKFSMEFNWIKGFNNLPGNTEDNIFTLSAEYLPIKYIPIRTGISVGGPGLYYISIGTGIKFRNFTLDVGTHGINQLIENKRFSVAVSTKIIL